MNARAAVAVVHAIAGPGRMQNRPRPQGGWGRLVAAGDAERPSPACGRQGAGGNLLINSRAPSSNHFWSILDSCPLGT